MDTMSAMEKVFPAPSFSGKKSRSSAHLEVLKQERRIIKRILKEAPASALVREVPLLSLSNPVQNVEKEVTKDEQKRKIAAGTQRLSQ